MLVLGVLIRSVYASPLTLNIPQRLSPSSKSLSSNVTAFGNYPPFQPVCLPQIASRLPITRRGCTASLKYLVDNHPSALRTFTGGLQSYVFPPFPVRGQECEILVYTKNRGQQAIFDYWDVYVDANAIIDDCGVEESTEASSWSGRVQMLDKGARSWNGFYVEVRALRHPRASA